MVQYADESLLGRAVGKLERNGFIRLGKHKDGCEGIDSVRTGWWENAFVGAAITGLRRDRLGRRSEKAFTFFLVFRCNVPECPVLLLLPEDIADKRLCVPKE